jgi:multiple sugar transport system ATP-binding protein
VARVVIENLTKQFKAHKKEFTRAVNGLSLSVEDGEFMVLVGPSGCGKSTTLRLIAGLEEPDSGTIAIDGRPMDGVLPKDRDIAMVFQNHALYPHMTARENMAFGLKVRKCPRAEIETRIREAAEMLELNGCLDRRPEHLSGGERQRVALGRAIVRKPGVFLFDEPLSNLDAPLRAQLRREIIRLHERLRATMIFVTHDQLEAMTMGHRIAVLNQGEPQQVAKSLEVYQRPANLFVAGFIGLPKMNLLSGTLVRSGQNLCFNLAGNPSPDISLGLNAGAAQCARLAGPGIILGIRPENIAVFQGKIVGHIPTVTAVAESVETTGADNYLQCRCGSQALVVRLKAGEGVRPGDSVNLTFDFAAVRYFDGATGKSLD